ncbi:hypothetical protein ACFO4E_29890, partial [Nocardiopsis mangrovi]
GHIDVQYHITKWGDGNGTEGAPQPMGTDTKCTDAVSGQGTSGGGTSAAVGIQSGVPGTGITGTDLPMAASAVTAAVLPVLAAAVLITKLRRPALATSRDAAGDRAPSLRERVARLRDEYMR